MTENQKAYDYAIHQIKANKTLRHLNPHQSKSEEWAEWNRGYNKGLCDACTGMSAVEYASLGIDKPEQLTFF